MVYGFLIQSVAQDGPPKSKVPSLVPSIFDPKFDKQLAAFASDDKQAAEPKVWISKFYTIEGNDANCIPRREAIAARVREEFGLQDVKSPSGASSEVARGVFPVPPGKLFATAKVVVWQQYMSSAFVLIMEAPSANLCLGANFLCIFISAIVEHFGNFGIFSSPAQFFTRPEDVYVLLETFLPNGQLSYIRGNLVKSTLDEGQAQLQMKSLVKKSKIAIS